MESFRGVAQPGSALGLGPRGRRFKSSRPDQLELTAARHGGRISCGDCQLKQIGKENDDVRVNQPMLPHLIDR